MALRQQFNIIEHNPDGWNRKATSLTGKIINKQKKNGFLMRNGSSLKFAKTEARNRKRTGRRNNHGLPSGVRAIYIPDSNCTPSSSSRSSSSVEKYDRNMLQRATQQSRQTHAFTAQHLHNICPGLESGNLSEQEKQTLVYVRMKHKFAPEADAVFKRTMAGGVGINTGRRQQRQQQQQQQHQYQQQQQQQYYQQQQQQHKGHRGVPHLQLDQQQLQQQYERQQHQAQYNAHACAQPQAFPQPQPQQSKGLSITGINSHRSNISVKHKTKAQEQKISTSRKSSARPHIPRLNLF